MNIKIGDVAATAFVTLYCHANEEPCGKPQGINSHITNTTAVTLWQATGNPQVESQSKDSISNDQKAVEITHELNKILWNSSIKLERELTEGKIDKQAVVHVVIRAKQYDEIVGKFLESSPEGVVVNIA